MSINFFQSRDKPFTLVVDMTGVRMGDRILLIGCARGGQLAAVAAKVGLSGQAVAIVPDEASAKRARKGAASAGVLLEIEIAPPTRLPVEDGSFDLAILDNVGGMLTAIPAESQRAVVHELFRILRPGGRTMVIGSVPPSGLGAWLARARTRFDPSPLFQEEGFRSVRILAEREQLMFVEALKPRG